VSEPVEGGDVLREIPMPRLSDSMEEATVIAWLKGPGESFVRGEALVEVETDKATVVYEAEEDGRLVEVLVPVGESAALGAPIARASMSSALAPAPRPAPASAPWAAKTAVRPRATPVARRLAAQLGMALGGVVGTGPGGRIVLADVRNAHTPSPRPSAAARSVSLTPTQRTIARRMTESRASVPDFTLLAEVDVTAALTFRRELNELYAAGVSINDLVVKATGVALSEHRRLNASFAGDSVVEHDRIHVGVAVATEDALFVPVVRDADHASLVEIARATRTAAERARARTLSPAELEGATFTVTNLGMFGVSSFQAVIDEPQAAILAVGRVDRRPAFDADGAVVARETMHLSLSCDHRVVYGAEAARFLQRVAQLLERPLELLHGAAATTTNEGET
jgi:pyruvate dehydrogenase E2 component (dihydrolipoyllysine-residue acetyltransferase)